MAELIPFNYRLRMMKRQQIGQWATVAAIAAVISLATVGASYIWERKCATANEALAAQYREKSTLITRSQELRARRRDLANRMEKIQKLMDDTTLLSLLSNISNGFSAKDCLDYISIDARAQKNGAVGGTDAGDGHYVVHITGITENSRTLADLMTRLGKSTEPPVNVVLQASKRETLMDGQVMHFEISCEQP
jgi:type VI protein secretion system component VasK